MALIDLTGRKFGRWLVEGFDETSGRVKHWHCVCECSTRRRVNGDSLRGGHSLSCGCLANEESAKRSTKHGMHKHPAYNSWRKASDRCLNPKATGYDLYGGRGITMCDRWSSFEAFWEDMGPTWSSDLTIDRINVNGNYELSNCRWASDKEQASNRRDNVFIWTPRGPMTVTQASEAFGINRNTIARRMRYGWPQKRLLEPATYHARWHKQA